ncbi:MAG TPA: ABC transporter ATP-binding protein [Opitutaceae bacterium]|jgi:spermidine/putrescine transport system ATP-binding protein
MIEARNITKRFGDFVAVRDVSLAVAPGEFLTLLGPSGCGKTTLLRVLAGFERPDEGAVLLEGKEITDLPPYRRNLNQVFQSYALFPHLSVEDNVAFGLKMRGTPAADRERRVHSALDGVALKGFEHRKPDQLSGGQRQRVALARALVCEPKVLLLDEPLSALDAKLRKAMQIELKQLQRRTGLSFVFVTHDQQEALTLSDRIAIMNAGRIEQMGTPEEIYRRPRTAFAADFIGQANLIVLRVEARAADLVRLRSAEGWSAKLPAGEVPAGANEITASARPENVRPGSGDAGAALTLAARVETRVFEGASDRLILVSTGGARLQAMVAAGSGPETGVEAEWYVPAGKLVALAR